MPPQLLQGSSDERAKGNTEGILQTLPPLAVLPLTVHSFWSYAYWSHVAVTAAVLGRPSLFLLIDLPQFSRHLGRAIAAIGALQGLIIIDRDLGHGINSTSTKRTHS